MRKWANGQMGKWANAATLFTAGRLASEKLIGAPPWLQCGGYRMVIGMEWWAMNQIFLDAMRADVQYRVLFDLCMIEGWKDHHRGTDRCDNQYQDQVLDDDARHVVLERWEREAMADGWNRGWDAGDTGEPIEFMQLSSDQVQGLVGEDDTSDGEEWKRGKG